jgi:hypothetical protein
MQAQQKNRVRHGIDCTMLAYMYSMLQGSLAQQMIIARQMRVYNRTADVTQHRNE